VVKWEPFFLKGIAKTIVDFGGIPGGFFAGGWDVQTPLLSKAGRMTQAFLQWCVRVSVVFLKVLLRFFALMAFFFVALVTGTLRARVTSMMAWCVMMQKMDSLRICCRTMKRALNRWLFFGMVFEKMTFSLKELGETEIERMGGSFWFVKRKVQRN